MYIRTIMLSAAVACASAAGCHKTERPNATHENVVEVLPEIVIFGEPLFILESGYRATEYVYKGQLHAHTVNSDGHERPDNLMRAYRKAGYDFVAITDHNHDTADPGVPGILFLHGMESDDGCLHENRVNLHAIAHGAPHPQQLVDQAAAEGSFVQINHPDWPGTYPKDPCWSDEALLAMHGYDAVEVWNSSDISSGQPNSEPRIDYLLSNGRRTDLTAVDDCHGINYGYCLTASVMVFADELTPDAIMTSLQAGNFYSSYRAGKISDVRVDATSVTVTLPAASTVEFIVDHGAVAKTERGVTTASYAVKGDEEYVRIRVSQPRGATAWTNPVYVTPREE
jgi:hypothetical protein